MKQTYSSVQTVELLNPHELVNNIHTHAAEKGFECDEMRQSFNSMISLQTTETEPISTNEHKFCAVIAIIECILILCMLIYGELSYWKHDSYTIDTIDNSTKIYNSSFTITCSWHSVHYRESIPSNTKYDKSFSHLCKDNIAQSCSFANTGSVWFAFLCCCVVILLVASIILFFPTLLQYKECKICSLKNVKYLFLSCGLLLFLSIVPVTSSMMFKNDLCGKADWNKNKFDGVVENTDDALWPMYLTPILALISLLSACFV